MNAWDTVLGQRVLESICYIEEDVDTIKRSYPTLRDQFAMSTLKGLISTDWGMKADVEKVAKECYRVADAMLAYRSKEN